MTTERDLERGPIFVVGVGRSGTTLLRYMLCAHPRLYLAPESNFIPRFFRMHPTEPLSRERALRILVEIQSYRTFWRDWPGDPPDAAGLIDGLDPITPAALIDALYRGYARRFGASRWGDKSTIYPAWIDLFVRMFPTCQIVHVIRDARDVVTSSLDAYRGPRFLYVDPYYAARMWRERLGSGLAVGRGLPPGRYHEIRYEELTADPEATLRELCAFLGEEFDPAMLSPSKEALKHYHSTGIHGRVRSAVTTARSGRWRRDLSPADQRLVQRVAGGLLVELGYSLDDVGTMGPTERVRASLLHLKFLISNGTRRVLRSIGVFNPARLLDRLPRKHRTGAGRSVNPSPSAVSVSVTDGAASRGSATAGAHDVER